MTSRQFQAEVNKLTLYLVYLFIAKFFLSYISMVGRKGSTGMSRN